MTTRGNSSGPSAGLMRSTTSHRTMNCYLPSVGKSLEVKLAVRPRTDEGGTIFNVDRHRTPFSQQQPQLSTAALAEPAPALVSALDVVDSYHDPHCPDE